MELRFQFVLRVRVIALRYISYSGNHIGFSKFQFNEIPVKVGKTGAVQSRRIASKEKQIPVGYNSEFTPSREKITVKVNRKESYS